MPTAEAATATELVDLTPLHHHSSACWWHSAQASWVCDLPCTSTPTQEGTAMTAATTTTQTAAQTSLSAQPTTLPVPDPGGVWAAAFNRGDMEGMLACYTDDAVLVPFPGAEPMVGHEAIEAGLRHFLAMGGTLTFVRRHWVQDGDTALSSVAFEMEGGRDAAGDPMELKGATSEVLRRQPDGSWKFTIDLPFGCSA